MGCGSCGDDFKVNKECVRCDDCWLWFHLECTNLAALPEPDATWICAKCMRQKRESLNQSVALQELVENQSKIIKELLETKATSSIYLKRQTLQRLPRFSGKCNAWPKFKDIYDNTTKEGEFSDVENASRLLEALDSPAKELVEVKLANPANLEEAVKCLEQAYGNQDKIYESLIQDVLSAKPPKDGKRQTFLDFGIKVSNLVCNLRIMKMDDRFKDARLIADLLSRMPPGQQERWFDHSKNKESYDLLEFDKFLQNRSEILRKLHLPEEAKPINYTSKGNVHIQAELHPNQKTIKCALCNELGHRIDKCKDYDAMSINSRWDKIKELKLCFGCLNKANHRLNQCKFARACKIDNCVRKHHKSLHYKTNRSYNNAGPSSNSSAYQSATSQSLDNAPTTFSVNPPSTSRQVNPVNSNNSTNQPQFTICGTNLNVSPKNQSLFMIVPVTAHGNGRKVDTYAFLDYGSAFTLMDSSLAQELELTGTPQSFSMICAKGSLVAENDSFRTSFKISARNKGKNYTVCDVRTVNDLGLPVGSLDATHVKEVCPHLKEIPLPSFKNVTPRILIGVNNAKLIAYNRIIEDSGASPIAVKTKFGWCLYGKLSSESPCAGLTLSIQNPNEEDENLHDLVKSFFTTESFGCRPIVNIKKSAEEERVEKIIDSTLRRINDERYEVGLLWKADTICLPNSYAMAYQRLLLIESRMKKDPDLAKWYVNEINSYLGKGYCKKMESSQPTYSPQSWYMPFFHVINANKVPRKIRLVFDAAAKVGKVSLNSQLLPGPNSYATLPGMIFKSREGLYCIAADIKEMFPQVKIREQDQVAQKFLWREGNQSKEPQVYVMTSMIFGACCSPYLAHTVKNKNALLFADKHPDAVNAIIFQHYVDDYLNSHNTVDETVRIAKEVIEIHKYAGFEIRNFISNSVEVLKALPRSNEIVKNISLNFENDEIEKILGVFWNISSDTYEIKVNLNKIHPDVLSSKRPPTKRELLRIVMSVFDPTGFLSHALIRPKILVQETWRSKIGWDENLTQILNAKWMSWFEKLKELSKIKIPRVYTRRICEKPTLEMHTFVDASELAFAAVVYFRFQFTDEIEIGLVSSKAKVAPNKVLSVPRLELQAALLGCRLANAVKSDHRLNIDRQYFWSDSNTTLSWILCADPQNLKPFVGVRVGEIHDLSKPEEWKKVPSKVNVADDATKWNCDTTYSESSRWFKGPEFLYKSQKEWPNFDYNTLPEPLEIRNPVYTLTELNMSFEAVPDQKFSSYSTTLRVLAYVIKFISCCRKSHLKSDIQKRLQLVRKKKITLPTLCILDVTMAESLLIRKAQFDAFKAEYLALRNNQEIPPKSDLIPFTPVMDSNFIIRINSRTKAAPRVSPEILSPAILPNKHFVTNLIIQHHHEKFAHQYQESVISSIRKKYWIIHIRSAVRRTKSRCQKCKNAKAKPCPTLMGELPICRLDWGKKPFTHTGMDLFGPINATQFRRRVKCYGMIFTCMVTRAIHLELALSLSADACILHLRNFTNRHGPIEHLYCDNGTNFHGAHRELLKELEALSPALARSNEDVFIAWHFNPPAGSHFGGAYERLIQSVQRALNVILLDQAPQVETLRSALIECENIVNARPLTHVPINCEDDDPLTPNHFIKMHSNCLPTPGEFTDKDLNLRKQWRISQQLANNFWKRWRSEVLPLLARRGKWFTISPEFGIGDVVLIVDNSSPRNSWKKGVIEKLIKGPDNISRVALVRSNNKLKTRPIMKLAKLDVRRD